MPIYAYKCESCGFTKDALQKMSDAPLSVCPSCGAATFTKQVTAAGFQLKGSGWYVTDFRGGQATKPAAADGAAAGEGTAAPASAPAGEGAAPATAASPAAAASASAPASVPAAPKKEAASPAPAPASAQKPSKS